MLYSRPVNQALAQFSGQKEDWSEPVVTALPLGLVNLYWMYCSCKTPKYESILFLFVCDWRPLLLVSCRFLQRCHLRRGAHSSPLPWDTMRIPSPKIEVSSSPSNSSALPSMAAICITAWRTRSQIIHTLLQQQQQQKRSAPCGGILLMFFCRKIAKQTCKVNPRLTKHVSVCVSID